MLLRYVVLLVDVPLERGEDVALLQEVIAALPFQIEECIIR